MELQAWLNREAPAVAEALDEANQQDYYKTRSIGFEGKQAVYRVLAGLRAAMFPGLNEAEEVSPARSNLFIGNSIRNAAVELCDVVERALKNTCPNYGRPGCSKCRERACEITIALIGALPDIRALLQTDIEAAYLGDPAACSEEEILLSYPAFDAISIYRIAHKLYELQVPVIPRIMTEYAHQLTGIDIHPGATIGPSFFIDHGTGVVIGETCTIGSNVKIYQGVTLGAKSFPTDENGNPVKGIKRHPDIGDRVVIYAGATILGGDTVVGADSVIGGNVWLTHSVPPQTTVYNAQPKPIIKSAVTEQ